MPGGGYSLDTGNGELKLDYNSKRLLVSIAEANLQIARLCIRARRPRFQEGRGPEATLIWLRRVRRTVSAVNIGGEDVTMFFGVNGPY